MEWIVLITGIAVFAVSIVILLRVRKEAISYTDEISACLDRMFAGDEILFAEEKDTLPGKIQLKIRQLYEIMQKREQDSRHEKEVLEGTISDISHQVKTPISNIRIYQELLESTGLSVGQREEFLAAQNRQIDKLEFLIQSLIKMSRLETGVLKVTPTVHSVYRLIEQVVCDTALFAEEKEIAITVSCEEELMAEFDPKWTAEALFNLINNAVKYTTQGGKIEISAHTTDFFVRVAVKDNGKGIEETHIPNIFSRFYREPDVSDTEGVGLGLYLAREIVRLQDGFLEVRSKKGEGSVFYLYLRSVY